MIVPNITRCHQRLYQLTGGHIIPHIYRAGAPQQLRRGHGQLAGSCHRRHHGRVRPRSHAGQHIQPQQLVLMAGARHLHKVHLPRRVQQHIPLQGAQILRQFNG